MARYVVKLEAVIEARDDRQAAELAQKMHEGLKNPLLKTFLRGQGVILHDQRVDPKPTRSG